MCPGLRALLEARKKSAAQIRRSLAEAEALPMPSEQKWQEIIFSKLGSAQKMGIILGVADLCMSSHLHPYSRPYKLMCRGGGGTPLIFCYLAVAKTILGDRQSNYGGCQNNIGTRKHNVGCCQKHFGRSPKTLLAAAKSIVGDQAPRASTALLPQMIFEIDTKPSW